MTTNPLNPSHPDRIRAINRPAETGELRASGEFVLLWLHHAVRAHENAALDVAIELANKVGRPLLVYQGLAGQHRFNSDRHHQFILQGALDVAAQFAELGITYVMHLPSDPAQRSPLHGLIERASAFVCEEFPAPPFDRWPSALTSKSSTPAWAVDACCVLPMQWHGRAIDRAFTFRDASAAEWDKRLRAEWPGPDPKTAYRQGLLPEAALADAGLNRFTQADDLAGSIARCKIDHSVAAISDTPGGSRAGYARWAQFKQQALSRYAKRRNDATIPEAVSRLSAYLHHGHVSAFSIAREAKQIGGDGAEKFLDELLVWRELAHHWCFYNRARLETLSAVPEWARHTLKENSRMRSAAYRDTQPLAQARTDDPLWNAAQLSLLRQGELHNNVRMTWGKALAEWSETPESALENLIDLNHRYALDGNNPNSYGGLLWCLGLFDRPFQDQPKSALGSIRQRPTSMHAGRLSMATYREQVQRPARAKKRIAIVGAGLAGLSCARALVDAGHEVSLFDKSRGVGGRMSTRRNPLGDFDHGAQYFTARDPRFERMVGIWQAAGWVQPWNARIVAFTQGVEQPKPVTAQPRFVAVPGMNELARHLAETLRDQADIQLEKAVTQLHREGSQWGIGFTEHRVGGFDAVLLAIPAPQAHALVRDVDGAAALASVCHSAPMAPCWASMIALASPLALEFDAAFINQGEDRASSNAAARAGRSEAALCWVAKNSSKPGRRSANPTQETWVLHASPEWSTQHIASSADEVGRALLDEFSQLTQQTPVVLEHMTHRWRYALGGLTQVEDVGTNERNSAFYEATLGLGVAGVWCLGGRVEAAFLSGTALAGKVLRAI